MLAEARNYAEYGSSVMYYSDWRLESGTRFDNNKVVLQCVLGPDLMILWDMGE
jgi:hypothetical protein